MIPLRGEGPAPGVLVVSGGAPAAEAEADLAGLAVLAGSQLEALGQAHVRRKLEARWDALLDAMAEPALLLTSAGAVAVANRALLCSTGYALEELAGRSLAGFLLPDAWDRVSAWLQHPEGPQGELAVAWRVKSGAKWPCRLLLQAAGSSREDARDAEDEERFVLGFCHSLPPELRPDPETRAQLQAGLDSVHRGLELRLLREHPPSRAAVVPDSEPETAARMVRETAR